MPTNKPNRIDSLRGKFDPHYKLSGKVEGLEKGVSDQVSQIHKTLSKSFVMQRKTLVRVLGLEKRVNHLELQQAAEEQAKENLDEILSDIREEESEAEAEVEEEVGGGTKTKVKPKTKKKPKIRAKKRKIKAKDLKKGTPLDEGFASRVMGKDDKDGYLSKEERIARFKGQTLTTPDDLKPLESDEKKGGALAEILTGVNSIVETLKATKKQDKKQQSWLQRMTETFKRRKKENKLEFKIFDGIKKTATKLLAPMKNAWQEFLGFLGKVILGRVLFKILEWMGKKENQGKLQSIIKFFQDWWPAMLAGYLLFGNAFTSFAATLVAKAVWWGAKLLATVIPALVKGLAAMGPWGIAAAGVMGVGGYMLMRGGGDEETSQNAEEITDEDPIEDPSKQQNFKEGGLVQQFKEGGLVQHFKQGGFVSGPGGVDKVPARLTAGEFVMSKGAVQKYGANTLASMNAAGGGTNIPTFSRGRSRYNEGGNVPEMSMNQQIMQQTDTTGTFGESGFNMSTYQATPEQRKASYADMGIPSMELWDGSVVPDIGKMGAEKIPAALAQTRQNMVESGASPERIAKLDELIAAPDVQPDAIQNTLNRIVPGSTEQVLGDLSESINLNTKNEKQFNGGGLVQNFQGGGFVGDLITNFQGGGQVKGNAANIQPRKTSTSTVITPSEKKKVTVVYEEEKQKMEDKPNTEQSEQKIPSFDVTAGRSGPKIKVLGISI